MTQLSEHFTLEEMTRSDSAIRMCIDQTPSPEVLENLKATAQHMELVRMVLGVPIHVNSAYRSNALNKAIGGASNSAHLTGFAVDFTAPAYGTPQAIAKRLSESGSINFDQCIYEGTWVHISFAPEMRRQVLTAHFAPGRPAIYSIGVA